MAGSRPRPPGPADGILACGYFAEFRIVGEIADMLLLNEPTRRLLVDLSTDMPGHEKDSFRKYPTRISLTVLDDALIDRIIADANLGAIVEATGAFTQSDYLPHRTTFIDTTFSISGFRILKNPARADTRQGDARTEKRYRPMH